MPKPCPRGIVPCLLAALLTPFQAAGQAQEIAAVPGTFQPSSASVVVDSNSASWERGVPLGGIGTHGLEMLPGGRITRIAIHNTPDLPAMQPPGTFLAVSAKTASGGGTARVLQVPDAIHPLPFSYAKGMQAAAHRSLFPFSEWAYTEPEFPLEVRLTSWNPLFPGSLKESSLPLTVMEVSLINNGRRPVAAAVVMSWQDLTGRGGSLLPGDQHEPPTGYLSTRTEVSTGGLRGVLLSPGAAFTGRQSTFAGQVFLGTVENAGTISTQLGWSANGTTPPHWWRTFEHRGRVDTLTANPKTSTPSRNRRRGSAVPTPTPEPEVAISSQPASAVAMAVRLHVAPGEIRTVPLVLAWHMPTVRGLADGATGWSPAYAARYRDLPEMLAWAGPRLVRMKAAAQQWQALVLHSTLPLDTRAMQLQSVASLVSHGIQVAGERFSMLEVPGRGRGMMGGLEFRQGSQSVLLSLFPELDREELLGFAAVQKPDGRIPRHVGNLHGGYRDLEPEFLGEKSGEATAAFLQQVNRHYRQTGDEDFRRQMLAPVQKASNWLVENEVQSWGPALGDAADPRGRGASRPIRVASALGAAADFLAGEKDNTGRPQDGIPGGAELTTSSLDTTGSATTRAQATTVALVQDRVTTPGLGLPQTISEQSSVTAVLDSTSPSLVRLAPTPTPTPTPTPEPDRTVANLPSRMATAWVAEAAGDSLASGLSWPVSRVSLGQFLAEVGSWREAPGEALLRAQPPYGGGERLSAALASQALARTALWVGDTTLGWQVARLAQASAAGRPTGMWASPLFEDRSTTRPSSASSPDSSYFQGHRGSSPWWSLPEDLAGFSLDVPRGILYLNPPKDRTGAPPAYRLPLVQESTATVALESPLIEPALELALMTPRAWLWLEWDSTASSATLTCLRTPPGRFEGQPIVLRTVATGRGDDGQLTGAIQVPEPLILRPGVSIQLQRSGSGWADIRQIR